MLFVADVPTKTLLGMLLYDHPINCQDCCNRHHTSTHLMSSGDRPKNAWIFVGGKSEQLPLSRYTPAALYEAVDALGVDSSKVKFMWGGKVLPHNGENDIEVQLVTGSIMPLAASPAVSTQITEKLAERRRRSMGGKVSSRRKAQKTPKKTKRGQRLSAAPSRWIAHVQRTRAKHGCSYKEALQRASKTWKA